MKNALTFRDCDPFYESSKWPQGFGVRQSSGALVKATALESGRRLPHSTTQAPTSHATAIEYSVKNFAKTLQSKCISSYLKLILVNQTFLASLPPLPILSNLKPANHCPVWIYQFGSLQKCVSFQREKT
jgi:hypothetical protein